MTTSQKQNRDAIEERFTATAKVFGDYAVVERKRLAETLARMVGAAKTQTAADLATGPGTLALRFAHHVKWIAAVDLTPAMLLRARETAKTEGHGNVGFLRADAQQLPIADGALDLCVTSYSLHHVPDQARMVREMARVVKRGGRVGIIDILVPDTPGASEAANRIEIARDRSHTRSLTRREFMSLLDQAGLRLLDSKFEELTRSFDHWLHVAGWHRGDAAYEETRRLMEKSIENDLAGFRPTLTHPDPANPSTSTDARPDLQMCNNALFLAAEKI
ncbi:MAG: methyltransferase domain-containing protein [Candidatus Acidiferrales bacterium]